MKSEKCASFCVITTGRKVNTGMREMDGSYSSDSVDQAQLRRKLAELQSEHRDLDDVIARLASQQPVDQLQLQRLKKRKLALKDEIQRTESMLLPDIIA